MIQKYCISKFQQLIFLLLGLVLWSVLSISCQQNKGKNIPDVSDIDVALKIKRFEQDLFNLDTTNMLTALQALETAYPNFSTCFFDNILEARNARDSTSYIDFTKGFITHHYIQSLYDTCQIVFEDFDYYEKSLAQGFRYFKYYFPDRPIPEIITFISQFGFPAVTCGEQLAIGLDMYLGADYPFYYYQPINYPRYQSRTFNTEHVTAKTFKALAQYLVGDSKGNRLIDYMIHEGKILYVLDLLLPHTHDSLKLEYTAAQTKWVQDNEFQMWEDVFVKELYQSDFNVISYFISPAPSSTAVGMPKESPGKTGGWVGWQIVKRYMEQFPETTLEELFALKDGQKILETSRYRPEPPSFFR